MRRLWFLAFFFINGCATGVEVSDFETGLEASARACYSEHERLQPVEVSLGELPEKRELEFFSVQAVETAGLLGVQGKLSRLDSLKRKGQEDTTEFYRLVQEIMGRLQLAQLQVAASMGEADCEEERAEMIAGNLSSQVDARVQRLSLVAILTGAAGAVTTGGLALMGYGTGAEVVAITTGATEGGLGIAALREEAEVEYFHPHNVLAELWDPPQEPQFIDPLVWRYLMEPSLMEGEGARRDALVEQWKQQSWLGETEAERAHRVELLFGEGGTYTIENLQIRAMMLDLYEAELSLLHRRAERFLSEIIALDQS